MFLRIFFRQLSRFIPLWPIRTLKKLFHSLFRGNGKYVMLLIFCTTLLIITSKKQRIALSARELSLDGDNINIPQLNHPEEVIRTQLSKVRNEEESSKNETNPKPSSKPKSTKPKCSKSAALVGNLTINPNITPNFDDVHHRVGKLLYKGGCNRPTDCEYGQKVAIIIPFKDREAHLRTLLYYLHPMLVKQKAYYCIYVAEQLDNGQFNKAMIMNAAFMEVMKIEAYDCIIFHDVDMIPENDKNLYKCGPQPRHLSPAIDKFKYKPHYGTDFGGVTGITPAQYRKANGHSNEFWGWGGEDNDMEFRIRYNNMKIIPSPLEVGKYKMIVHTHPWQFKPGEFPKELNSSAQIRAHTDGLIDLEYRMISKIDYRSYTKLILDIRRIDVKAITMFVDGEKAMTMDVPPERECQYVKYEGKYLEFKLELSQYKEAERFRPKIKPLRDEVPPHMRNRVPKVEPATFSFVETLPQAQELCDLLQPDCRGIQIELNNRYTLRREGLPRNLAVTVPEKPQILRDGKTVLSPSKAKRFVFPSKGAYLRYCPGGSGYIQRYEKIVPVDLAKNRGKAQHKYRFEIEFSVLLQPTPYLYYIDKKVLEGHSKVHENLDTLKWPGGGRAPNFKDPSTPKDGYKFVTAEFSFPTIPGCYGIESRIVNGQSHPYFQWLWWVDVSSGNRSNDAFARHMYKSDLSQATKLNSKKHEIEKKRYEQMKREYLFEKEMAFIKKQPFVTNPVLEKDDELQKMKARLNLAEDMPQFLIEEIVKT